MNRHYTFGDNPRAADRLALLAAVFEPSSARWLERAAPAGPGVAVDLGCGPGYTTHLVHRIVGARETSGLDTSGPLIERARGQFAPECRFAVHDIATTPYPIANVDLAYARYVLTHLRDPAEVLLACAKAVRSGGHLVLEENCALSSDDPLFAEYYRWVEALQRNYGQDPYPGHRLAALAADASWTVEAYECTPLRLAARDMARLHAMNIRTWGLDPFAASAFGADAIARMTRALDAVAEGDVLAAPVTCVMGQALLRR